MPLFSKIQSFLKREKRVKRNRKPIHKPEAVTYTYRPPEVKPSVKTPKKPTVDAQASRFSMNTDGSSYGGYSKSHQGRTATGISNGGEIPGYTIPLDSSLKRIKKRDGKPVAEKNQAAILTFFNGEETIKLLAVGNDTGGRHIGGNKYNRGWGELGVNTWKTLKDEGVEVKMSHNYLSTPKDLHLNYEFLPDKVYSVKQYRDLKKKLTKEGLI